MLVARGRNQVCYQWWSSPVIPTPECGRVNGRSRPCGPGTVNGGVYLSLLNQHWWCWTAADSVIYAMEGDTRRRKEPEIIPRHGLCGLRRHVPTSLRGPSDALVVAVVVRLLPNWHYGLD